MTLSVTLGWWVAPAAITLMLFGAAYIKCTGADQHAGIFTPAASAILALFLFPLAAVGSLFAWLVWALVT